MIHVVLGTWVDVVQVWVGKRNNSHIETCVTLPSTNAECTCRLSKEEFGLFLMPEGEEKRMRKRNKKGGEGCDGRGV